MTDETSPTTAGERPRLLLPIVAAVLAVAAVVAIGLAISAVNGKPHPRPTPTATPTARPSSSPSPATSPTTGPGPTVPPTNPSPSPTAGPAGPLAHWPDATNTGVPKGTVLTPSGDVAITRPGTVIEKLDITGCVEVKASNVTIRQSRIKAKGCGVRTDLAGTYHDVLVEDVEIDGQGDLQVITLGWTGFTCRRCFLHGGFSGAHPRANTVIEDSYITTMVDGGSSEGRHLSGIGFHGGSGMVIRHNRVECEVSGCSAALALYGNFEQVADVTVEDNYFSGGGYCVYGGSLKSKPFPQAKNTKFLNNAFAKTGVGEFPKCGRFGPVAGFEYGEGNAWNGNYWLDPKAGTKTPLNL